MLARGETIGEPCPCIRSFCACRRLLASTVENSWARTIGRLDKIANIMCQTWNSRITIGGSQKKKIIFLEEGGEKKRDAPSFIYIRYLKKRKEKKKEDFKVIIDYFPNRVRYSSSFGTSEVNVIFNMQVAFNSAFMSLRVDCIKGYI